MRLSQPSLDRCKAAAEELRVRGMVPLFPSAPAKRTPKEERLDTHFYHGPVTRFLERAGRPELIERHQTRWAFQLMHYVAWAPEWVACAAHGLRFTGLPESIVAPELFAAIEADEEARRGIVRMYDAHTRDLALAMASAELLGGPDAVETLLLEVGLNEPPPGIAKLDRVRDEEDTEC